MTINTSIKPDVYTCFEPVTGTWQYLIADPQSHEAVIIDSVLDIDPGSNRISTESADKLLELVSKHSLLVSKIMETHAHADHLTAATYLQGQLVKLGQKRPDICIGKRIKVVQSTFCTKYGVSQAELGNVFDKLFDDNEEFSVGQIPAKVLYLPGHTPDHVGYIIGENVFTGDSIFNPDVGSARADFPGGSATDLYHSTQVLLSLPPNYRLYVGHDYPPESRSPAETGEKIKAYTTVAEQKEQNKHVKAGISEAEFVKFRSERDAQLGEPRLLHQAMQFNIRAGHLPPPTASGDRLLHVPLKASKEVFTTMQMSEVCGGKNHDSHTVYWSG
jgi:glyoxylase-like metal-dependent hydrolase (beta-lactamase superfamily II)